MRTSFVLRRQNTAVTPDPAPDAAVAALLPTVRRVAVLGVSDRFTRPSFRMAAYLFDRTDWDVDLVNPHVAETLGRWCVPTLDDVPATPDLVVVFRHPRAWAGAVDAAARAGARGVWLATGTDRSDNLPAPGPPEPPPPAPAEIAARGSALGVVVTAGRDLRADHRRWVGTR